jgi:hypothetical protein
MATESKLVVRAAAIRVNATRERAKDELKTRRERLDSIPKSKSQRAKRQQMPIAVI